MIANKSELNNLYLFLLSSEELDRDKQLDELINELDYIDRIEQSGIQFTYLENDEFNFKDSNKNIKVKRNNLFDYCMSLLF